MVRYDDHRQGIQLDRLARRAVIWLRITGRLSVAVRNTTPQVRTGLGRPPMNPMYIVKLYSHLSVVRTEKVQELFVVGV